MLIYSTMYQPHADITMVLSSLWWLGWWVVSGKGMSGVELLALGFDGIARLVGVAAMMFNCTNLSRQHLCQPTSLEL